MRAIKKFVDDVLTGRRDPSWPGVTFHREVPDSGISVMVPVSAAVTVACGLGLFLADPGNASIHLEGLTVSGATLATISTALLALFGRSEERELRRTWSRLEGMLRERRLLQAAHDGALAGVVQKDRAVLVDREAGEAYVIDGDKLWCGSADGLRLRSAPVPETGARNVLVGEFGELRVPGSGFGGDEALARALNLGTAWGPVVRENGAPTGSVAI